MWPLRSMSRSESPSQPVLVVGAGGYLGEAIVRALVKDGRDVRGLVRTPAAQARAEAAGARTVRGDVLDFASVAAASQGCEAIVHVAAVNSPSPEDPRRPEQVRVEGCRQLLRAARENQVRRLVVGSGYWVYADNPGTIREDSPLDPRGESLINYRTEEVARDPQLKGAPEVIVVRPGMVYGNGSWCRAAIEAVLGERYSYIGGGRNPWSFISLEDAGSAFVRVAARGKPGEVYNLVDGRPAPWKEFGDFLADRLSCRPPSNVSDERATANLGPDVVHHLTARRACSATKLQSLGWAPRFPDFRAGLPSVLEEIRGSPGDGH